MTDLAVARSAKDIDRIAAMIDRHRDADEGVSVSVDQDVMRKVLTARRLLDISHQIDGVFDGPLLANPGWDILLDLFIQRSEGKRISIISVCIAANAPTSTVLRYIQAMMDAGTIIRTPTSDDTEGMLIALSDKTYAQMQSILN